MSEFSESYHLPGSTEDAVDLLIRASARGAVLPGAGRFTAMIVHDGESDKLKKANRGVLLEYHYNSDEGCWIGLLDGPKKVTEFEQCWKTRRGVFRPSAWLDLGVVDMATAVALSKLAKAAPWPKPANLYEAATTLGLDHYAWLSSFACSLADELECMVPDVVWIPERPETADPLPVLARAREPGDREH